MSRTKKSRNPNTSPAPASKGTNRDVVEKPEKRARKHKGKQAGNKQKEATQQTITTTQVVNKDPRLGSKKLIELGKKPVTATVKKTIKAKEAVIATKPIVEPQQNNKLADELEAIEQDPRLLAILSKQDDDIALTENEVEFFNEKMARHQDLRDALGLSDDEDEDDNNIEQSSSRSSEDELWDKFDQSDLSKFE